jgi:hypothetical protein
LEEISVISEWIHGYHPLRDSFYAIFISQVSENRYSNSTHLWQARLDRRFSAVGIVKRALNGISDIFARQVEIRQTFAQYKDRKECREVAK